MKSLTKSINMADKALECEKNHKSVSAESRMKVEFYNWLEERS